MIETLKNFLALFIATVTWLAGCMAIGLLCLGVFTLSAAALLLSLAPFGVMGIGLYLGKRSVRVQAALEYPLGFLGGLPG